jgi:NitT/TauT family transport system permease protein
VTPGRARAAGFGLVVLAILLWEGIARMEWVSPVVFPPPSRTARALVDLTSSGRLPSAALATLARVGRGLLAGALPGLLLGLAMGASTRVRRLFDPLVAAIHPLPKLALLPLVLATLGIGEGPRTIPIALSAFFPMLLSAATGVRQIPPLLPEMARSFGASHRQLLWRVILPGSLPYVLTGLRISVNAALVMSVALEMIAAPDGLGVLIWYSWETMRIEPLYGGVLAIALLGMVSNALLEAAARRLVPWRPDAAD